MPTLAIDQRVLVTFVGEYFGQTTMTTHLYRVSAVTGSASDVAVFTALHAKFTAAGGLADLYAQCTPANNSWHGREIWYQIIAPTRYRAVKRTWEVDGEYDTDTSTANIAAVITKYGIEANRKNIGSAHIPIGSEGGSEGLVGAGLKLKLQNLANELNAAQATAAPAVTFIPQVGLPGYKKGPPPVPGNPMLSVALDTVLVQDTMRVLSRRTVRRGI